MSLTNKSSQEDAIKTHKKYFGEPTPCRRCGLKTAVFYHETSDIDSTIICPKCKLELNPPRMLLVLLRNGRVWNATDLYFEDDMRVGQFEQCGWFIRKKVIRTGVLVQQWCDVYLEYFGVAQCLRCSDHPYFYHGMPQCYHLFCRKVELVKQERLAKTGMFNSQAYLEMCAKNNPYRV